MSDRHAAPRGMILAAGYGTRLAPVTDHLPKPLLPVPGGTVLDRAVAALDTAGVGEIAVNTHHLPGMIAAHLAARPDAARFHLCPEPEILGTGGALRGAAEFLGGAPCFLLHNGDVLADIDLAALLADHRRSGAVATLVLVDWPAVNSVALDADGNVTAIAGRPVAGAGGRHLTYAGIAAVDRSLLDDIGPGPSSLVEPLLRAVTAGPGRVRGFVPADPAWSDLGTPARYLEAVGDAGALATADAALTPITGHGSDRRFWRLAAGPWSAVAMRSPAEDTEFARAVAIGGFLHRAGLGAADVLHDDREGRTLLLEDVGEESLASLVTGPNAEPARTAALYRGVVAHLQRLQAATDLARRDCPAAVDRVLDLDMLAWETGYFRERFLVGHCGLEPADLVGLGEEFAALNAVVAGQPLVLVHRDFQARNIHLQDRAVRLVDVQGMRLGPLGYDLASLVWDPYVALPPQLREDLVAGFAAVAALRHGLKDDEVVRMVAAAALQRLMQALGAYGYLGHVKGRAGFLDHIPRGLAHLRAAVAASPLATPVLARLLATLPDS